MLVIVGMYMCGYCSNDNYRGQGVCGYVVAVGTGTRVLEEKVGCVLVRCLFGARYVWDLRARSLRLKYNGCPGFGD